MVDVMVSDFFPVLSLVKKEYNFEHFPLKYSVIIETVAGLRLFFIGMSGESKKDWNCSQLWLGDLYKQVRKHCLFFMVFL